MGGYGSGQWRSGKSTTGSSKRIDIRYLRKNNLLMPGNVGILSWSVNGESCGSIDYKAHEHQLEFNYSYKPYDSDGWVSIQRFVSLESTPCNYGGKRQWFLCPDCGRRCEILYQYGSGFTCRKCADLVYGSQQEQAIDRAFRQARKIRHHLISEFDQDFEPDNLIEPVLFKPKQMHQKTFDRLRKKQQRYIDDANGYLALYLNNSFGLIV